MPEDIKILLNRMTQALQAKKSAEVESAVNVFLSSFHNNAQIINGYEHALLLAAECYAFLGDKENALEYIRLCEWNNYPGFNEIVKDENLKILWDEPEFKTLFNN